MYKIFDNIKSFTCTDDNHEIKFICIRYFTEYDDSFTVETECFEESIGRGWHGEVRIVVSGVEMDAAGNQDDIERTFDFKDALCLRRTLQSDIGAPFVWQYEFSKY